MSSQPVKKEWSLDVYRYSESRGWQKQIPEHFQEHDPQHALRPNAMGEPQVGYIAVKRYRLKLVLTDQRTGKLIREVVRRNDCLLLTSNNYVRVVVLKFPSTQDCIEFSTRLMQLNPMTTQQQPSLAPAAAATGTQQLSHLQQESHADTEMGELHRNEVLSYIARLMHDQDFQTFMNKVERIVSDSGLLGQLAAGGQEGGDSEGQKKSG